MSSYIIEWCCGEWLVSVHVGGNAYIGVALFADIRDANAYVMNDGYNLRKENKN